MNIQAINNNPTSFQHFRMEVGAGEYLKNHTVARTSVERLKKEMAAYANFDLVLGEKGFKIVENGGKNRKLSGPFHVDRVNGNGAILNSSLSNDANTTNVYLNNFESNAAAREAKTRINSLWGVEQYSAVVKELNDNAERQKAVLVKEI